MKVTIVKMDHQLFIDEDKKKTLLNGYAFLDEMGCCRIIVYGEKKRDLVEKYLSE